VEEMSSPVSNEDKLANAVRRGLSHIERVKTQATEVELYQLYKIEENIKEALDVEAVKEEIFKIKTIEEAISSKSVYRK
jgi:hypothetical protein